MNANTELNCGKQILISAEPMPPAQSNRFTLVDGLRGFAALSVTLHHMLTYSVMEPTLLVVLPTPIKIWCDLGPCGVQIFFVISGFVIANSLVSFKPSLVNCLKFIAKRQMRLDPPYWAAIALVLLVDFGLRTALHFQPKDWPTVGWLAANALYTYRFVDTAAAGIVQPAWTLCLEIQFYVVFILALCLTKAAYRKRVFSNWGECAGTLIFCTGIASLLVTPDAHAEQNSPFFFDNWFYFAGGAICFWCGNLQIPAKIFVTYCSVFFVAALVHSFSAQMLSGFATTVLLFLALKKGFICSALRQSAIQYLGKISYSLYLVHGIIGASILRIGYKLTGANETMALVWFVASITGSIFVAHLFYIIIEKPSLNITKQIKVNS